MILELIYPMKDDKVPVWDIAYLLLNHKIV